MQICYILFNFYCHQVITHLKANFPLMVSTPMPPQFVLGAIRHKGIPFLLLIITFLEMYGEICVVCLISVYFIVLLTKPLFLSAFRLVASPFVLCLENFALQPLVVDSSYFPGGESLVLHRVPTFVISIIVITTQQLLSSLRVCFDFVSQPFPWC